MHLLIGLLQIAGTTAGVLLVWIFLTSEDDE